MNPNLTRSPHRSSRTSIVKLRSLSSPNVSSLDVAQVKLLQVLALLNTLSNSRMGRSILSQSSCVSRLLNLLLDHRYQKLVTRYTNLVSLLAFIRRARPSPKLVLIILQLCRVALPTMAADECQLISLPQWNDVTSLPNSMTTTTAGAVTSHSRNSKPQFIAKLLLAKLGDFLVPGQLLCSSLVIPSKYFTETQDL